jgi:hypothetical protein
MSRIQIPYWYRPKYSRSRWGVFDARSKLDKADLTRRDDASLLGEQWGANGRAVG